VSSACTQIPLSAKAAKHGAHTVFVGTITALRAGDDGDRIATFRISRIWKGKASENFEMSMLYFSCYSIDVPVSVEIGAELLIFAGPTAHSQNGLMEWQLLTTDSGRQRLQELGSGRSVKPN
jgi:hypothetical protein